MAGQIIYMLKLFIFIVMFVVFGIFSYLDIILRGLSSRTYCYFRLLRKDIYNGSYQDDGLKDRKTMFQMVTLMGLFKPDFL